MSHAEASPSTDESLLVRLRDARDDAAWRTFVDLYMPLVYRYARRLGLQDADAQDATQSVFERVSRAIRSFDYDPEKGSFRGWLGTLTYRAVMRQRRQERARPDVAGGEASDAWLDAQQGESDPQWIEEFNARVCQAAMGRIRLEFDPVAWRAFQMTWIEGRAAEEAAAALGRPKPWVYVNKFRILKRLREEIQFLTADVAFFNP